MKMEKRECEKMFNPQSIAIIGATDGVGKVGAVITRNILNLGYPGKVYLVNPNRRELFSRSCYPNLEAIEDDIDLAIVAIPAALIVDVIKKSAQKTKNFVVISAGFAESGEEGKKREKELVEIAAQKNLNILGPNCLGFINPYQRINATFSGGMPKRGNIALISQSGALAVALMDIFEKENIGFSGIFSIGNKAVIDEGHLIEYLEKDSQTRVIGLYLEGIKNGANFLRAATRAAKTKPIVILKPDITKKSRQAIISHTGALAGSDEVASAAFQKAGTIRAANFAEFVNILKLTSLSPPPLNDEVIIVTNAGGVGVLASGAFRGKSLRLGNLSSETITALRKILPAEASLTNPIDLLGDAKEDRYEKTLEIIDWEKAGSVICILTPQEQTPVKEIARKMISFIGLTEKTVIGCFSGGEKIKEAVHELNLHNIPNFLFPEQIISSLDKYCFWNNLRKKIHVNPVKNDYTKRRKVLAILENAKKENKKSLNFAEALKIMEAYDINTVKTFSEGNLENLTFPAVVKIDSELILHKTEKEAVILNIKNKEELKRAFIKLKNRFPGERLICQPMLSGHIEMIVGVNQDEVFGPVIVYGLGGIYTEFFRKTGFLIPPLGKNEIEESLKEGDLKFLFNRTRGKKSFNKDDFVDVIDKIAQLALENPEIKELDINPLFLYNDKRKVLAADIKIII